MVHTLAVTENRRCSYASGNLAGRPEAGRCEGANNAPALKVDRQALADSSSAAPKADQSNQYITTKSGYDNSSMVTITVLLSILLTTYLVVLPESQGQVDAGPTADGKPV